jgi:HD-like signal output (HDOD) protein
MEVAANSQEQASQRAKAHEFFHMVMEKQRLPSMLVVANKVLHMVKDPDVKLRELCRLLSDDAGLVTRMLAVARSPHYAKRNVPTDLLGAVSVLGLKTVRRIVLASATESLTVKGSRISEQLWTHSLAVGLGARLLAHRVRVAGEEDAFLAGVLHDIGQMVFAYGDAPGYQKIADEAQQMHEPLHQCEERAYGVDHALIGVTLLEMWNIEGEIGTAVLNHHASPYIDRPSGLTTILSLADYLSVKADLGCVDDLAEPPDSVLPTFHCDGEERLAALLSEIKDAFTEEVALFRHASPK